MGCLCQNTVWQCVCVKQKRETEKITNENKAYQQKCPGHSFPYKQHSKKNKDIMELLSVRLVYLHPDLFPFIIRQTHAALAPDVTVLHGFQTVYESWTFLSAFHHLFNEACIDWYPWLLSPPLHGNLEFNRNSWFWVRLKVNSHATGKADRIYFPPNLPGDWWCKAPGSYFQDGGFLCPIKYAELGSIFCYTCQTYKSKRNTNFNVYESR